MLFVALGARSNVQCTVRVMLTDMSLCAHEAAASGKARWPSLPSCSLNSSRTRDAKPQLPRSHAQKRSRTSTMCMAKGTNARKRQQMPFQQIPQAPTPKVTSASQPTLLCLIGNAPACSSAVVIRSHSRRYPSPNIKLTGALPPAAHTPLCRCAVSGQTAGNQSGLSWRQY